MRINISKKDVVWSYASSIMSMGSNLFMLPFIIYFLSDEMLGMWYLFVSIGGITTLFDFGFSATFARNITYCWSGAKTLKRENVEALEKESQPNYALMKKVLITCRKVYLVIAIVALFLLLTLGTLHIYRISGSIEGYQHFGAWLIYVIAVFCNLYYGYFSSFLIGVGAINQANKNIVIARSVQIVLTILLLFMGTGITGTCTAYLTYGLIVRILGKNEFFRYQNIGVELANAEELCTPSNGELFMVIWHNAWKDGLISASNYICNQATTIICSLYLSLSDVGVYSLGVQMAMAISTVAGTLYITYQPVLQDAYINKDRNKICNTMSYIVMTYVYLFTIGVLGVSIVVLPILRIIKPDVIVSIPIFILLCSYQFILKFRNCYTSYFSCTNRIPYLLSFVVSAMMSIIFSVIVLKVFKGGITALVIAQIFSQAIYNIWVWPHKVHKEIDMNFVSVIQTGTKLIIEQIKKTVMCVIK